MKQVKHKSENLKELNYKFNKFCFVNLVGGAVAIPTDFGLNLWATLYAKEEHKT